MDGRDRIGPFPTDRGWDPDVFHPDPDHPRFHVRPARRIPLRCG
nr:hypothetical protein [Micromonospora sagamiensis]